VSLVATDDILGALESQRMQTSQLLAPRSERDGNFRYAPGKWNVKEVVGHLSDAERIFSYRAMRIARGDVTPLASFDQDDYIRGANFAERTLADLSEEFSIIRAATLALFRSLNDDAWSKRGTASNNEVTVRALAYIIAGHELHHRRVLDERYF